jgi:PST family polysaccharide transporter
MGVVLMSATLVTNATGYLTRMMVIREISLEAAGLYQAAWGLSGVYVGIVLGAMGSDYYPRLTAVAKDNTEVSRLVNEQAEAALLMAVPGIMGTLTFAPWVIHLLYSAQFEPAGGILRWQILSLLGRIIIWPVGFVILAKGRAGIFFFTELTSNVVTLIFTWLGMKWFGLNGVGMACFGSYIIYVPLIYLIVHRQCGFKWTPANLRLGFAALLGAGLVFMVTAGSIPVVWGRVIGGLLTGSFGLYGVYRLAARAGYSDLGAVVSGLQMLVKKKSD